MKSKIKRCRIDASTEKERKMFSKSHTLVVKGIAIMLLLFHHLFYSPVRSEGMIVFLYNGDGIPYIQTVAIAARVCVMIFLMLSGIGMYKKMLSLNGGIKEYYKSCMKSLLKLMLNFWCIFIIFVPIALYLGLGQLYGDHIVRNIILDFLGLARLFGTNTINGAWWYLSVVIVTYFLAPLFFECLKRQYLITVSSAILMILGNGRLYNFETSVMLILYYVGFFVIGMCLAKDSIIDNIMEKVQKIRNIPLVISGLIFMLGGYILKTNLNGIGDVYFGIIIIIFAAAMGTKFVFLEKTLSFLGKHSGNMYFLHSFLYYQAFLHDFIYGFKYPVLIFLTLLILSLGCSIIIEEAKKKIGFYKVVRAIR